MCLTARARRLPPLARVSMRVIRTFTKANSAATKKPFSTTKKSVAPSRQAMPKASREACAWSTLKPVLSPGVVQDLRRREKRHVVSSTPFFRPGQGWGGGHASSRVARSALAGLAGIVFRMCYDTEKNTSDAEPCMNYT